MDNLEEFSEDKLPDRYKSFRNRSLKDECVSEKDYLNVIDVWNVFKINTVGNYYDLYLKTDVLLLADVY